jgi:hypothetical protein
MNKIKGLEQIVIAGAPAVKGEKHGKGCSGRRLAQIQLNATQRGNDNKAVHGDDFEFAFAQAMGVKANLISTNPKNKYRLV